MFQSSKRDFGFMSLLAIVGAYILSRELNRPFEYDELYTAFYFVDTKSYWDTISTYLAFNNHIGFSVLARFSLKLFGTEEWVIRLPAILMGIASIPVMFLFAKNIVGRSVSFLSCLLLTVSPLFVIQSSSARGYSGLVLLTLLSSIIFLKNIEDTNRKELRTLLLVNVALHYFHLYGFFVTLSQGVLLTYLSYRKGFSNYKAIFISLFLAVLISVLVYLPALSGFLGSLGHFKGGAFNPEFPEQLLLIFLGNPQSWELLVVCLIFVIGIISLLLRNRIVGMYFLFLLILPVTIAWFISPRFLYPRFFIFALPIFFIVLANGTLLNIRKLQILGKLGVIATSLFTLICFGMMLQRWWILAHSSKPTEGFKHAVEYAEKESRSTDIFCGIGGGAPLYDYYTKHTFIVPASLSEMLSIARNQNGRMICLYRQSAWQPGEHTEIADYMRKIGHIEKIDNIEVLKLESLN